MISAFFITGAFFAVTSTVAFLVGAPFHLLEMWAEVIYPISWSVIWLYLWWREVERAKS